MAQHMIKTTTQAMQQAQRLRVECTRFLCSLPIAVCSTAKLARRICRMQSAKVTCGLSASFVASERLSTAGWPQSGHRAGRLRSRARFEKRVICLPCLLAARSGCPARLPAGQAGEHVRQLCRCPSFCYFLFARSFFF